jgi:hypothetical protein
MVERGVASLGWLEDSANARAIERAAEERGVGVPPRLRGEVAGHLGALGVAAAELAKSRPSALARILVGSKLSPAGLPALETSAAAIRTAAAAAGAGAVSCAPAALDALSTPSYRRSASAGSPLLTAVGYERGRALLAAMLPPVPERFPKPPAIPETVAEIVWCEAVAASGLAPRGVAAVAAVMAVVGRTRLHSAGALAAGATALATAAAPKLPPDIANPMVVAVAVERYAAVVGQFATFAQRVAGAYSDAELADGAELIAVAVADARAVAAVLQGAHRHQDGEDGRALPGKLTRAARDVRGAAEAIARRAAALEAASRARTWAYAPDPLPAALRAAAPLAPARDPVLGRGAYGLVDMGNSDAARGTFRPSWVRAQPATAAAAAADAAARAWAAPSVALAMALLLDGLDPSLPLAARVPARASLARLRAAPLVAAWMRDELEPFEGAELGSSPAKVWDSAAFGVVARLERERVVGEAEESGTTPAWIAHEWGGAVGRPVSRADLAAEARRRGTWDNPAWRSAACRGAGGVGPARARQNRRAAGVVFGGAAVAALGLLALALGDPIARKTPR